MQLKFLAFWAINDRLDEIQLFRQLGEMKHSGFDRLLPMESGLAIAGRGWSERLVGIS